MKGFPSLALAVIALVSLNTLAGAREFEDSFGRIISAELVSHTGVTAESVKIRKTDGKEFDIKIATFSQKDQKFIRAWMQKTPATVNYAFRIEAVKKKAGRQVAYLVEVTNLTRQTVKDISVKTRALYEYGYSSYLPYKGSTYWRMSANIMAAQQKFEIPGQMKFNQTAKFATAYRYSLVGIMVQVYDGQGNVVGEKKLGSTKIASLSWDAGRQNTRSRSSSSSSSRRSSTSPDGGGGDSRVIIED